MKVPAAIQTWGGIDVSAKTLHLALLHKGETRQMTFENTSEGHKTLLKVLTKKGGGIRVVLEATGNHHLDLALHLARHPRLQLMVANPGAARNFARARMRRSKTDTVDAQVLLEFAQVMPFTPWQPPSDTVLELRAVTRYLDSLITHQTAIKNRRAALLATETSASFVLKATEAELEQVATQIEAAEAEALRVARSAPELSVAFERLDSIPGIDIRSGVRLLGELCILEKEMTADQVVAHAGLDPRARQSGTSDPRRHISKQGNAHLRGALYMPAVTASRWDPAVRAWYEKLRAAQKPAHVAHVAVMRRLLRVAWTLLKNGSTWESARFRPKNFVEAA